MFCPACGRAISDSSRYCPYCNEYVKNAPREEHRKPLETEAFRRREERIEAMRRSNRRRKRLYGLLIAVIVLILAAVAVAAFVQHFRETHPAPELTTEEKRTTEPLTAPSTHAVSAGHDSETLAGFDEATARFLSLMETGVDELPLGSKVPADEGYGSFAYYDESDSGLVRAMEILRGVDGIGIVEFDRRDIVRHPLVKYIVEAFDRRAGGESSEDHETSNSKNG